jgi:hypothetical protein
MEFLASGRFWLGVVVGAILVFGLGRWQQKNAGN